jgi:hypothetical protein
MYNAIRSNLAFKFTIRRLSYGISTRLQRAHPTEVMKFHDWEIPPGVSASLPPSMRVH